MEEFSFALIWLGFFASIFLGWYFYLQARNKERMALIEKNATMEIFQVQKVGFRFPWLKFGMIVTGGGFGLCLSFILMLSPQFETLIDNTEGMVPFGLMFFFGGLGIVIAHYLEKPKEG